MKIAGLCLPLKPQKERIYNKKQLGLVSLCTTSENCESLLNNLDTQTYEKWIMRRFTELDISLAFAIIIIQIAWSGVKVKTFGK